jgi:tetratricopeptide (TPR) repeat protein
MRARKQNAAFLKRATKLLFTLLLIVLLQSHTITKQQIISRAESFKNIPPAQLFDSVNAFYTQLYIYDQGFSRELIGKLLSITKGKSPEAHFLCLSIKAEFHPERNIELIDSAYRYATKHNIAGATHEYYMRKSHFFRQNQQYNSSMVYLLRARDLSRDGDFGGYVHILHMLGDIYYSVNLYDQAEKYYLLVDSLRLSATTSG